MVKQMQIIKQNVREQLDISVGNDSCEGRSCISTETELHRATQECLQSGLIVCIGVTPPSWRSVRQFGDYTVAWKIACEALDGRP